MKLSLKIAHMPKSQATCLILGVYEDTGLTPIAKEVDHACGNYITKIIKKIDFKASLGQILPIFQFPKNEYDQIILVGLGKDTPLLINDFRKTMFNIFQAVDNYNIKSITCYPSSFKVEKVSLSWQVKQIAEMLGEAFYQFDALKSQKAPKVTLKEVMLVLPDAKELKTCKEALLQGEAIARGVKFTRTLANLPSNICTPTYLAQQAKLLAKENHAIAVKILEENDMQQLKMGGILGVSQGSAEKPKLICLQYKGSNKKSAPIALIGKGVTFDTGGISLKPADSMVGMKYDMCGAATVLGVFKAAAELNLPINLVGILPAVENMPGGHAYKPEDILTTMSGQTIEVINTDAEGRLILADALTYCERYQPDSVIDIATLTGAVIIALGFQATGLLANDESLARDLLQAGIDSNDRAWQLPLWKEYEAQLESPFADFANTGGRAAGAITAACFLSKFAKKFKWAHLDVAGTAAMMMGTAERKATGRPVYLLMQYLIHRAGKNVISAS